MSRSSWGETFGKPSKYRSHFHRPFRTAPSKVRALSLSFAQGIVLFSAPPRLADPMDNTLSRIPRNTKWNFPPLLFPTHPNPFPLQSYALVRFSRHRCTVDQRLLPAAVFVLLLRLFPATALLPPHRSGGSTSPPQTLFHRSLARVLAHGTPPLRPAPDVLRAPLTPFSRDTAVLPFPPLAPFVSLLLISSRSFRGMLLLHPTLLFPSLSPREGPYP